MTAPVSRADVHASMPVLTGGPPLEAADAALIIVHGRGGTAEGMRPLYRALSLPRIAVRLPQAAGNTWYPRSFLAPLDENEPSLSSALERTEQLVRQLIGEGMPPERIALLGFSQGACLVLEHTFRNPRRYGAVMGLTGGLIGPQLDGRRPVGDLAGTPVFLGSGDPDPHVPFTRVEESAALLTASGARVELRRYPGMPHTVNDDELAQCRALLMQIGERR